MLVHISALSNTHTQIPTQEQLEAMYKLPANQEQLEALQKNMVAFMEQQQKQQEISRKLQVLSCLYSDREVCSFYPL